MTENPTAIPIETAAISDRGLNEKRPLNEDSMLSLPERGIFAVADGVGGAQAGEVASSTAIEVLEEAFKHHKPEEDVEDLMEIAIQRANDSIYRMSREQPALAMMATTIVALHIDGHQATIGHVGDSRLYRLTPTGQLRRETADHSLVEEEVRAGRMTPEQAANHPGRNVISRAIGAEASVEVDMRSFEVEDGTTFLLCSDGITRHIPDAELSSVLRNSSTLNNACEEMKRLCYERGAEDNLTAVLVRVGGAPHFTADEDPTLISERTDIHSAPTLPDHPSPMFQRPFDNLSASETSGVNNVNRTSNAMTNTSKSPPASLSGATKALGVLALLLVSVGLAFYVGMIFERKGNGKLSARGADANVNHSEANANRASTMPAEPTGTPSPVLMEDPQVRFEHQLRAVDRSPETEAARMASEMNGQPLTSDDPDFLYLYGRALLLTNRPQDAVSAFDRAIQRAEANMTPHNGELKIDALLAKVAAHMRAGDQTGAGEAVNKLNEVTRTQTQMGDANSSPTP
jgi:serine/threonine protein phosphatase PrpC